MQITTRINPKALEAISLFVAKENTRYALTDILVEVMPTETRFVATDGHVLAVYRMLQDNNIDRSYTAIISPDVAKQVKAMTGKVRHGFMVYLTMDTNDLNKVNNLAFDCGDLGHTNVKPIDGRYPDYLMVMPKEISGEPGIYPPERLITFDKAAKVLSKHHPRSSNFFDTCHLYQNGTGAGVVTMREDPCFTGLVMPTNADTAGSDLNAWWLGSESGVAND